MVHFVLYNVLMLIIFLLIRSDKVLKVNSLIQMMGKLYNQELPIRPAPSRYLLNIFNGGSLNINEYREPSKTLESSHILNLPPI